MSGLTTTYTAMSGSGARASFPWPPARQPALPPFPAPVDYPTTILLTPPSGPSLAYYRGNFCGVRVPGVEIKPGMAGYTLSPQPSPPLVMDLDIFKYRDQASQARIFQAHVDRGLTHFQFSLGHAVEQNWTPQDFLSLVESWRALGGFADLWWLGGAWMARDQPWSYWLSVMRPWLDVLGPAGVIDHACIGWQLDQYNSPSSLLTVIRGLGALLKAFPSQPLIACHWINDACAWWDDTTGAQTPPIANRFDFHRVLGAEGLLDRDFLQVDVNAPPAGPQGGFQGVVRDLRRALVGSQQVVAYEFSAQNQFDDPNEVTEQTGSMRDYLACCAGAFGYGNGGTFPDGSIL